MNYQNVSETSKNARRPKMHINPNFVSGNTSTAPHINPNFYAKLHNQVGISSSAKIHVNPKFVKNFQSKSLYGQSSTPLQDYNKQNTDAAPVTYNTNKSKYKLVNVKPEVRQCVPEKTSPSILPKTVYHGPIVKTSKYSLVRKSTVCNSSSSSNSVTSRYQSVGVYKPTPKLVLSKNAAVQRNVSKQSVHRKIDRRIISPTKAKLNISYASLLNKSTSAHSKSFNKLNTSMISIRGQKFSATENSLKLIGTQPTSQALSSTNKLKVRVNGKVYVQKSRNLFVRKNLVVEDRKLLKKNNIPCPLFSKFGKCIRSVKGFCSMLHDKKHVSLCRDFLKGKCQKSDCLLSHQVSAEKMPTCSFFLQGCCTREHCPYLHVKLSDSALVCTDFLKGYCERGDQCTRKHEFLCPDFAKNGACCRKKCPYPHKRKVYKMRREPCRLSNRRNVDKEAVAEKEAESAQTNRYYVCDETKKASEEEVSEIHTNRCQLGTLPSFIKL